MPITPPKYSNFNAPELITDINNRWSDDFGGVSLDPGKWDVELAATAMTYSVTGSNLTVNMNTTANDELRLLSREAFLSPFDFTAILSMSQRIANNSVYIEAVEVNPDGVPVVNDNIATDWRNRVSLLLDGTVATSAKLETVAENSNLPLSQSGTIITTASPVDLTVELRSRDVQLASATPDTANSRNTNLLLNSSQVPDPTRLYKLRLRFKNGASAPASNTQVVLRRIYVQDCNEVTVEVASGRGDNNAGRAVAVNVPGGVALTAGSGLVGDVALQLRATGGTTQLISRLLSAAASLNPTNVKATAGKVTKIRGFNAAAAVRYLKLYDKATAPTVGTDVPVITIPLAASSVFDFDVSALGLTFATGIGYGLTTGAPDADVGVLTAGDIVGMSVLYL